MNRIWTIASNTWRSHLQKRSLSLLLFFAVALIVFLTFAAQTDEQHRARLIQDTGMTLVKVFGLLLVFLVSLPALPTEMERNILPVMIASGVPRSHIIGGIYLGSLLTLATNVALSLLILALSLWVLQVPLTIVLLRSWWLMFVELSVLSALALLCSVLLGVLPAMMTLLSLYVLGNASFSVELALENAGFLGTPLAWLSHFLPHFILFDLKDLAIRAEQIPLSYDLTALVYAASLIIFFLILADWIFERREIV